MWCLRAPAAVCALVAVALLPSISAKPYPVVERVHIEELRQLHNASHIDRRQQCAGTPCGYYGQLCCTSGQSCITDASNQAQCVAGANQQAGSWIYSTYYYTETDLVTRTSVYSTLVPAQATGDCGGGTCGSICCQSGYWCSDESTGTCKAIGGGSSPGVIGTMNPSAPLRPTSSTLIIVTATGSPTATVPFESPIATGVNGTLVPSNQGGGGLSGGAIAGIVIGVILGIILLLLICFYCCARALFDTIMAIFGLGRKRKHTHEETYTEEHHHTSGAGGGGRRWYGAGPGRPSRPPKKEGGGMGLLGMAGLLGGLAVALGLKRRHDRRHDDKSTAVSGSSYYYSDYTSSSSASSSDRRTRNTRHSSRR